MTRERRAHRRIRRERAARARRRLMLIRGTALLSIIAVMAIVGINALTTAFARDNGVYCDTIIVSSGDTLWDIAGEYNTSNKDIRTMVDKIMRANNMKTTKICAGDRINIPLN